MTDPTHDIARRLRAALARRAPATLTDAQAHRAAVAVIVTEESEPALLFIRRRERVGDPWSGHVAFPGGYSETTDASAIATAVRETWEETGLELDAETQLLGNLDDVYPRSAVLPKVIVTPVVFVVPRRGAVSPKDEIVAAVWVPAREVFDPGNVRPFEVPLPTGSRTFDSIVVGDLTIWGLTERILAQLRPFLMD